MSLLQRRNQHRKLHESSRKIILSNDDKENIMTAMSTLTGMSKTHGMFAMPEIEAMMETVRKLPSNPLAVVLGAGPGTATISMLAARPDIVVYSVDIIDAIIEHFHAEQLGYLPRLHQIKAHSQHVSWDGRLLDLLFVDACHTYPAVKADNAAWLPYLKVGGIAWYHDYGTENGMWLDVKRAVDEDMAGQEQIVRTCSSIAFRWKPAD
jgi:hypothetical protein